MLFLAWFFYKNTIHKIQYTKYNTPILLIIAGLLLSILVNKNYYTGLGVAKGWFILPIIFAIILYDNLKKDEKLLDKIFITLFASGAFVAIEGIYYWLSGLLTYDGRLRIFYDSPNQLAMFLAPAFLIGAKLGFEELRARVRKRKAELWKLMGIILGLILIFFNLYLTKSYGAWIAITLALVAVFWLKYRKIEARKYLAMVAIVLIIFLGAAGFSKLENIKNLGSRSSLASRVMIWESAGLMIEKNPIFGIGPGNFQNTYLEYQKYFSPYLEWAVPQPHNLYLAFWLESGLFGLAGFLWLIWLFFKDNKKAIINNRSYGILCLAIILYFLIHGLVDTTYWRNDMAILFWAVVAANVYLANNSFDKLPNADPKPKSENIKITR